MKIQQLKTEQGWINGYTPPPGFTLNNNGFAVPSTSLISAVQAHIGQTNINYDAPPLPPVMPFSLQPIPPIINTNPNQAGIAFGRRGSRQQPAAGDTSVGQVSSVSINGRNYTGSVFDANGNRIT